ncbi:ssl1498 family light-harvesting-like protein [Leptolyngbya sp. FACHB-36]|uniref:photosystem II assembly protein Psb34 n=1 Tax=Leptolyngbya sp. FACHB-36 TaxID=2692808 RepID=UPI0016803A37|nr:ssl1498 family light-harvesting-like protein [Leptolyngbya sp. FACHB-36]MBD2021678.1 ssl1498 family light-harvesting-like protein [Leptolyngbya sp. FACHB-36]
MRYTTDERGILNNYAIEPVVYAAEYPSLDQQRQYKLQAACAALLMVSTLLAAFAVS